MAQWRRWFRSGVIRSARSPLLRGLYRKLCQLITWIVGLRLAAIPGVVAVYTRHSHPRFITFAPGQSDLDLTSCSTKIARGTPPSCVPALTKSISEPLVFPRLAQDARWFPFASSRRWRLGRVRPRF